MNIGIDIDNTLTDIEEALFIAANKYSKELNREFAEKEMVKYEGFTNLSKFYSNIFGWNEENINYFFRNQRLEVVDNARPRGYSKEVVKKLKDEGNNIYIVTARTNKFDDIPYERAKIWLDKNDIVYDKLVVGAVDKASVCKNLNIDIFIDDQLNNCINLSKSGIHTIRLTNSNKAYENIVNITNWNDIYKYISNLK